MPVWNWQQKGGSTGNKTLAALCVIQRDGPGRVWQWKRTGIGMEENPGIKATDGGEKNDGVEFPGINESQALRTRARTIRRCPQLAARTALPAMNRLLSGSGPGTTVQVLGAAAVVVEVILRR